MDGEVGTRGDNFEKNKRISSRPQELTTVGEIGNKIMMVYMTTVSTEVCFKSCVYPQKGPPFCLDTQGNFYREYDI